MGRTLVTHARVLALQPGAEVLEDVTLVLEGRQVATVVPEPEARDAHAEVVDAEGGLVFPGLVNAHAHAYSALARGLPVPIHAPDFATLLERLWWRLDGLLELEDVRVSAALALAFGVSSAAASPAATDDTLRRLDRAAVDGCNRVTMLIEFSVTGSELDAELRRARDDFERSKTRGSARAARSTTCGSAMPHSGPRAKSVSYSSRCGLPSSA